MLKISREIFFLMLVTVCLICGCSSDTSINTNKSLPLLVFSDVHFNPYYDPSLFQKLVAADVSEWESIFKSSSITAPSTWGSDTNYPLFALALSSIKQNSGTSPLVIYTGDILVHKFQETFFTLYGIQDSAAMQAFADKTVAFFVDQVRSSVGNLPVMFTVGNNDSYDDNGPDSEFLANTAELYYSKFLNGTGDHQGFLTTYKQGGYYSAELPGSNLMVIGLNTVAFSSYITGNNDSAVNAELAWFDAKLSSAKAAGKKVWLLMHLPPGVNIYEAGKTADGNGHIDPASTTMMEKSWIADYQTSFLQTVAKYPGVIVLTLAGHTHMDEYRILPTSEVVEVIPSISPRSGNNPAFRIVTFSSDSLKSTDYRTLNYDLATTPGQFNSYYTFSKGYFAQGLLDNSLTQLFPTLLTNDTKQASYRGYYYSGNNSLNTINNTNWPNYWCGIGNLGQQEYIDCVNSY